MAVTRNFYEAKSVTAFLLYAIQTGDTTGAEQAAAELVDSGLKDVVDDAATLLLLLAPPRYGFLPREERWKAALSLRPFVLPTPLRRLPLPTQANAKTKTKTCPWNPVKTDKGAGPTIWSAVEDALKRGRIERAATLSLVVAEEDRASCTRLRGENGGGSHNNNNNNNNNSTVVSFLGSPCSSPLLVEHFLAPLVFLYRGPDVGSGRKRLALLEESREKARRRRAAERANRRGDRSLLRRGVSERHSRRMVRDGTQKESRTLRALRGESLGEFLSH